MSWVMHHMKSAVLQARGRVYRLGQLCPYISDKSMIQNTVINDSGFDSWLRMIQLSYHDEQICIKKCMIQSNHHT